MAGSLADFGCSAAVASKVELKVAMARMAEKCSVIGLAWVLA